MSRDAAPVFPGLHRCMRVVIDGAEFRGELRQGLNARAAC